MIRPANPNKRIIQLYLLIQQTAKSIYDSLFLKCQHLHSDLTRVFSFTYITGLNLMGFPLSVLLDLQ